MTVSHHLGTYAVEFCPLTEVWSHIPGDIRIVTDTRVEGAWAHAMSNTARFSIPPGEASKSIETYKETLQWLYATKAHRQTTLVAVGGGVVGDLGGFVAATYMRGIPYVQVPTTLLAQVDSSVGGKVAVDLPEGKNLVGAFHAPAAVFVCLETLQTLSPREFTNGMAEVWKYGFAVDETLLPALRTEPLKPDSGNLGEVVRRCIALKAQIVEEDEWDTTGRRAVLNFGHTVGHALEKLDGYANLLHGEAIAIGMVAEARIGERIGLTPKGTSVAVSSDLERANLPVDHPLLRAPALLEAMRGDKKAEGSGLAFSLLETLGRCKLVRNVPADEVAAALSIA